MLIPALAEQAPEIKGELLSASREAAAAMEEYVGFLEAEVLPKASGDFAVGKELFEEMLRENHMLDYTADELLELGRELFRKTKEEMELVAAEISPDKSARDILRRRRAITPRPRSFSMPTGGRWSGPNGSWWRRTSSPSPRGSGSG